jgi:hypothetical protein
VTPFAWLVSTGLVALMMAGVQPVADLVGEGHRQGQPGQHSVELNEAKVAAEEVSHLPQVASLR